MLINFQSLFSSHLFHQNSKLNSRHYFHWYHNFHYFSSFSSMNPQVIDRSLLTSEIDWSKIQIKIDPNTCSSSPSLPKNFNWLLDTCKHEVKQEFIIEIESSCWKSVWTFLWYAFQLFIPWEANLIVFRNTRKRSFSYSLERKSDFLWTVMLIEIKFGFFQVALFMPGYVFWQSFSWMNEIKFERDWGKEPSSNLKTTSLKW